MDFRNVFVVYDPTRSSQPALDRAALIADDVPIAVHVFACIFSELDGEASASDRVKELITKQKEELQEVTTTLTEKNIPVTIEVEWDKDWYEAVVRASIRHSADVVLKSSYPHTVRQRILNRTSDWTLIRECLCPVLLVRDTELPQTRKVLAAVDIRDKKGAYEKLNEQIINFSQKVMEGPNAEVHFVNAFNELKSVPDRSTLAKSCGVANDRIHIQIGKADEVIAQHAKDIDASLVIVGNSARTGVSAMINGNTVERVLDKLECDVLSIP